MVTVHPLTAIENSTENLNQAKSQVERIFGGPAGGLTNYINWFHEMDDQLDQSPENTQAEAWLIGDGINTTPLDMRSTNLGPQGIRAALKSLQPLPDCRGWRIHFVGVNRTRKEGVTDKLAEGAERFWRAFGGEGYKNSITPPSRRYSSNRTSPDQAMPSF